MFTHLELSDTPAGTPDMDDNGELQGELSSWWKLTWIRLLEEQRLGSSAGH
jgi:hypothetical protein